MSDDQVDQNLAIPEDAKWTEDLDCVVLSAWPSYRA